MKIVLLTSEQASARERILLAEGLLGHPSVEPTFNRSEFVMGHQLTHAAEDIYAALEESDYIFQFEDEHFFDEEIKNFIQKRNFYGKLVYLDYKDSSAIEKDKLERSHRYFKRSWPRNSANLPDGELRIGESTVYPSAYGALNAYFDPQFRKATHKYDISYLFAPNVSGKRKAVLDLIREFDFGELRINLNVTTMDGGIGRRSITKNRHESPWAQYYNALNSSKIVFTVLPDGWDGDSRTWEALSCKAMAFIDRPILPFENKIEHMKHAYLFDAFDRESSLGALQMAVDLLQGDDEVRMTIADQGTNHAAQCHKGVHRVNAILERL